MAFCSVQVQCTYTYRITTDEHSGTLYLELNEITHDTLSYASAMVDERIIIEVDL